MTNRQLELTDLAAMLAVARDEAAAGLAEGGIPVGAALFDADGVLLGRGRNRRVQNADPTAHGETEAFRSAGRQRSYRGAFMATTLAPCWYCSGLIRQFGITNVVIGENLNFIGGEDWLAAAGHSVRILGDEECISMMAAYIDAAPAVWLEDIGVDGE